MATGWAAEGAVQDQIDATVKDAVERAKSRLPNGPGLTHCEECDNEIPAARRAAIPGVRLCLFCVSWIPCSPAVQPLRTRVRAGQALPSRVPGRGQFFG